MKNKKKMKFALKILLLIAFVLPVSVYARSEESDELFDIISESRNLNIANLKTLDLTLFTGGGDEPAFDPYYNMVISYYINNLPGVKEFKQQHSGHDIELYVQCIAYDKCGVYIEYDNEYKDSSCDDGVSGYPFCAGRFEEFKISMPVVKDYNQTVRNIIKTRFKNYNSEEFGINVGLFNLLDMAYINQLINNFNNVDNFLGIKNDASNAEMFFPEVKEILENYPSLQLSYSQPSAIGGGGKEEIHLEKSGDYLAIYDGTVYDYFTMLFRVGNIILVDKSSTDLIAAATNRIKEYIDDPNISVVIEDVSSSYNEKQKQDFNKTLNYIMNSEFNDKNTYSSSVYKLKIGNNITSTMLIVPVDSSYIEKLEVKSIESKTGIKMSTSSSDVPMDASLQISDVTSNYEEVVKAYDINLYSSYINGYIKNVKNGIKLMIPVENDFDPEGKSIYYINTKGEKEQKFDYKVETIDGKKYITFVTNHLSVYAISNDKVIKNPETGNFSRYGILLFAFSAFLIIYVVFRKHTKFPKITNK